jgi:hypothetical protein
MLQTQDSPLGVIPISSCLHCCLTVELRKEHGFKLDTPTRTYLLSCDTKEETDKWVQTLQSLISSQPKHSAPNSTTTAAVPPPVHSRTSVRIGPIQAGSENDDGWREYRTEDGVVYFYNETTGESKWEL